jgi:hypothetical protein
MDRQPAKEQRSNAMAGSTRTRDRLKEENFSTSLDFSAPAVRN